MESIQQIDEIQTRIHTHKEIILHPSIFFQTSTLIYSLDWYMESYVLLKDTESNDIQSKEHSKDNTLHNKQSVSDLVCEVALRHILEYLDGPSLARAQCVNHYFYDIACQNQYWLQLCISKWSISPYELSPPPASYQALYKLLHRSQHQFIQDLFQPPQVNNTILRNTANSILASRSYTQF